MFFLFVFLNRCLGGSLARAQSLFCLAWFHAVCQERRNYIPQVKLRNLQYYCSSDAAFLVKISELETVFNSTHNTSKNVLPFVKKVLNF